MKQKSASQTPRLLQILFIVGLVSAYASQTIFSIYVYFQGMQTSVSQEFATLNLVTILTTLIPLVVWGAVHLTRRDRKLSVKSLFESLLLTMAAIMVMMSLGMVQGIINFYPNGLTGLQNMWWFTFMNTAVPLVIIVCGLTTVILHLRRQKQW